jgi:hypothetical protein
VNIDSLVNPVYPVIVFALVSILVLVLSGLLVVRKTSVNIDSNYMQTTT